ncbi:MAG: hypothetical protein ABFS02_06815 [Pseudomonadota bacterium]
MMNFQDVAWTRKQSTASLARLLPRLEGKYAARTEAAEWQGFVPWDEMPHTLMPPSTLFRQGITNTA